MSGNNFEAMKAQFESQFKEKILIIESLTQQLASKEEIHSQLAEKLHDIERQHLAANNASLPTALNGQSPHPATFSPDLGAMSPPLMATQRNVSSSLPNLTSFSSFNHTALKTIHYSAPIIWAFAAPAQQPYGFRTLLPCTTLTLNSAILRIFPSNSIYIPGHFTYKKLRHARNFGLRKTQANKNKIHLYIGFIYFNRMYNI